MRKQIRLAPWAVHGLLALALAVAPAWSQNGSVPGKTGNITPDATGATGRTDSRAVVTGQQTGKPSGGPDAKNSTDGTVSGGSGGSTNLPEGGKAASGGDAGDSSGGNTGTSTSTSAGGTSEQTGGGTAGTGGGLSGDKDMTGGTSPTGAGPAETASTSSRPGGPSILGAIVIGLGGFIVVVLVLGRLLQPKERRDKAAR